MSVCLAAGMIAATLPLSAFTLAWTHSIEKIRWEEDWRVEGKSLVITAARIRGSGAGMEPPPDAVLKDGVWHYRPNLPPQKALRLTHSPYAAGYILCTSSVCMPLADRLPGMDNNAVVNIFAC